MLLLRDLDFFKAVPETRFKGQKGGHSSFFGRALTLLIVALSLGLLIYFSLDMMLKTNPQIQTFGSVSNGDLVLNNETFPFAFGLRNKNGSFYQDETIYGVKAFFSVSKKTINLVPCKPTNFPGVYDPTKEGAVWCFSDQQDVAQIGINGAGGIEIDFIRCDPTLNTNCQNDSTIDSVIFGSRLRIIYRDVVSNPSDYLDPIDESSRTWDPSVAQTMVKESCMYLTKNEFITDNGWLLKNIHNETKVTVDDRVQYFEDTEVMGSIFKVIYLRTYGQIRTNSRLYDNVQNVLARWNAIFTVLIIFGKIISDSYNRFKTQETLVQDIFFLKKKRTKQHKNKKPSIIEDKSFAKPLKGSLSPRDESADRKREQEGFAHIPSTDDSPLKNSKRAKSIFDVENNKITNSLDQAKKVPKTLSEMDPAQHKTSVDSNIPIMLVNNIQRQSFEKERLQNSEVKHFRDDLGEIELAVSPAGTPQHKNLYLKTKNIQPRNKERVKRDLFQEEAGVSFGGWLCSKLKKTEQYKLHLKREEIIQEEFDFQNYAKRFIGIDVLKYLLLTKDQLTVFDNCVKAYVNLKLDTLTRGSVTDDAKFDELRKMFNTHGFSAETEDDALQNLKDIPNPDENIRKTLHLLDVLYEREN